MFLYRRVRRRALVKLQYANIYRVMFAIAIPTAESPFPGKFYCDIRFSVVIQRFAVFKDVGCRY